MATKFGFISHSGRPRGALDSSPASVKAAVEGSLQRLDTDYIDLCYQHRVDPQTPIEDTVGALAELVAEGKVRHIGLSEAWTQRSGALMPSTRSRRCSRSTRCGRATRRRTSFPLLRELGIGFVAYSPLGRGFLTGAVRSREDIPEDDNRRNNPRFNEENFDTNLRLADEVAAVAAEVGATPGQVALAWLLAQGEHIVPIPGTKRVSRVEENCAADAVELTSEQVERLTNLPVASGDHHAAQQMLLLERS